MKRLPSISTFTLFFLLTAPLRAPLLADEQIQWDYRPYTDGHVDIGIRFVNGELEGFWKNDGATVDGEISAPDFSAHEVRALGIFDENTPPLLRPAGSQWDFLGVAAGEPIYILSSSGTPNTVPYLGISSEDDSLNPLEAEPHQVDAYRITLLEMTAPPDGVFTLYGSTSNILMSTLADEFPAGSVSLDPGNHLHFNWAFSQLGTYDLTFEFEALSGGETLFSASNSIRIQITGGGGYENYAHWRRTHFRPGQIPDDSISGPDVDAGKAKGETLSFTNAQRYAFGNDPQVVWSQVEHDGELYPAVQLFLRKDSGDLLTQAQSATAIDGPWSGEHLIEVEIGEKFPKRIFHDPGLEERLYRLNTPPSDGPLFFRSHGEITEQNE